MVKKEITFKNLFTDEEETGTFYFNLSKADLVELEAESPGGLQAHLQKIIDSQDNGQILDTFKKILKKAYGVRSEDGKRLIKNDEVWEEFHSSEAYSELIMEFFTDGDAAAQFVNGLRPNLDKEVAKLEAQAAKPETDVPVVTPRILTRSQATEMDGDELQRGLADGSLRIEP